MNHSANGATPPTDALKLDAGSMAWLLTHSRTAADFFCRGVAAIKPIADQDIFGRVVAEGEFRSGADTIEAVAIMGMPLDGAHRLMEVALRHPGDRWPTLCSELEGGLFTSASSFRIRR